MIKCLPGALATLLGAALIASPVAAQSVLIEDTVIRGFRATGPSSGAGIKAAGTAKVTVVGSTLADNRVAIKADVFGTEVLISDSTITGNAVVIESTAFVRSYANIIINHHAADGTLLPKIPLKWGARSPANSAPA